MSALAIDQQIAFVRREFGRIYLGGIPSLLNNDGAFLSFICVLTAVEALAGFRHPKLANGPRFRKFVQEYFPTDLKGFSIQLWSFRNGMIHGFQPGPFAITHHNSQLHLTTQNNRPVLNAEEFYSAIVDAARHYFGALSRSKPLQKAFGARLADPKGGLIVVQPVGGP
jgi:hypothetical protein